MYQAEHRGSERVTTNTQVAVRRVIAMRFAVGIFLENPPFSSPFFALTVGRP
jgi:hypothetical protein